jgi:hypothetical protein
VALSWPRFLYHRWRKDYEVVMKSRPSIVTSPYRVEALIGVVLPSALVGVLRSHRLVPWHSVRVSCHVSRHDADLPWDPTLDTLALAPMCCPRMCCLEHEVHSSLTLFESLTCKQCPRTRG